MMTGAYPSEVVRVVCAVLSPFIMLFGLYVIAHGHYGPGGGFAGGVFVAVGLILPRLTLPIEMAYRLAPVSLGPLAAGIGLLSFLIIGLVPLFVGGAFLDYAAIEIAGVEPARIRYLGILVVEVAVGLAVAGAMLMIFDVLTGDDGDRRERDAVPDPTTDEPTSGEPTTDEPTTDEPTSGEPTTGPTNRNAATEQRGVSS